MLKKYTYKYRPRYDREEVSLDDFYAASDLSFISGTTDQRHALGVGDSLWVSSPYFPEQQRVTVMWSDTVKRNGYILYPLDLEIKYVQAPEDSGGTVSYRDLAYVEYNGDTFFQQYSSQDPFRFTIDGRDYEASSGDTAITISAMTYIEDDRVVVDGTEYGVLITSGSTVPTITFTDNAGNKFIPPNEWVNRPSLESEYVQKVTIANGEEEVIGVRSISRYGYRSYVVYSGEKMYLHFLYASGGTLSGYGVTVDGVDYPATMISGETPTSVNQYSKSIFQESLSLNVPTMLIKGFIYEIYFEPSVVDEGNMVCVETEQSNMDILLDDILTVRTACSVEMVPLMYDDSGSGFAYINGTRYPVIRNLCDSVVVNGSQYRLTYAGNPSRPYAGMLATCTLDDGGVTTFRVTDLQDGRVTGLKRVRKVGSSWNDAYTVSRVGNDVRYVMASGYTVVSCDGIDFGGEHYPVEEEQSNASGSTMEVVRPVVSLVHKLRVVDTVGGNRLVCTSATYPWMYGSSSYDQIVDQEIASMLSSRSLTVSKMPNTFGRLQLTPYEWAGRVRDYSDPVSVYGMSQVGDNISVERITGYISLPLPLSKTVNDDMNTSDLIMSYHYDDEADAAVNPIVDMDKDQYTPVINTGRTANSIEFNLHFRTRDLDTWEIIEDEGRNSSGNGTSYELSADYRYCNWFVTDYYPYNQYASRTSLLNTAMRKSDLLGMLYFTTDDVASGRDKLSKSFLRLTFFDSRDPERQNMLGTSTLFMGMERLYDKMYGQRDERAVYADVLKTTNPNRIDSYNQNDKFTVNRNRAMTVFTECYMPALSATTASTSSICALHDAPRLDSRIIAGRNGEGYMAYILKAFADRDARRTIYMKAEFFHAGIGIKIPMAMATGEAGNAIVTWDSSTLDEFKKGYPLDEVFDRMYIPIDIWYEQSMRKYVYSISSTSDFWRAAVDGDKFVINLFELKTRPQ